MLAASHLGFTEGFTRIANGVNGNKVVTSVYVFSATCWDNDRYGNAQILRSHPSDL